MNDWVTLKPGGGSTKAAAPLPSTAPSPTATDEPGTEAAAQAPDTAPATAPAAAVLPRPELHACSACAGTGQVEDPLWWMAGQLSTVTTTTTVTPTGTGQTAGTFRSVTQPLEPAEPRRQVRCTLCRGVGWVLPDGFAIPVVARPGAPFPGVPVPFLPHPAPQPQTPWWNPIGHGPVITC